MKKTNVKSRPAGGVAKDIRVKAKMVALEYDVTPKKKKKRESEDDLEDEAPKKKKKSTELVVLEEEPKRLSKLKGKGMKSIFGDNSEKILQLLEINDTDSAVALIYKKALSTLVDLLPFAEHAIRKSKGARGVYQINSLISSMRELLVDIQSAQDRGLMGQSLMANVIRPTFTDLAQEVVKEYGMIGADAKNGMTEKEWSRFSVSLKESRSRLADNITMQYRQINEQTISFLQR